MVYLTKGQQVPFTEFVVITGGEYHETDIIPVKKLSEEIEYCAYQAYFIANGEIYYGE